jgi:PTS system glucitol/sorbitol-specific IIA component
MKVQKYVARVTAIGELAGEFIAEGILVFFSNTAPEELQEHAVVHDNNDGQAADVQVGDTVKIGDDQFPVLAVGTVANENLRNLGHLVLKFNGLQEAEMQGDVNVPEVAIPEITIGTTLEIIGD